MSKIYTKNGDDYFSKICTGKPILKSHLIFDILGDLDELNSFIGLIKIKQENSDLLTLIQKQIFRISGEIAQYAQAEKVTEKDITFLEEQIDLFSQKKNLLNEFVKLDKNEVSALLHIARTVCRRCERNIAKLKNSPQNGEFYISKQVFIFINRLSDLLFVLAEK